jgi:hypothetical protein
MSTIPFNCPSKRPRQAPICGSSSITRERIDLPDYGWIDLAGSRHSPLGFDTSVRPELPLTSIGPANASHGGSDVLWALGKVTVRLRGGNVGAMLEDHSRTSNLMSHDHEVNSTSWNICAQPTDHALSV